MWGLPRSSSAAGLGELFDTLVVFENYPVDRGALAQQANGLRLGQVEGRDATHYPLALIVQPGEALQLRLDYRADLFERAHRRGAGPAAGAAADGRGCGRRRVRSAAWRSWTPPSATPSSRA